MFPHLHKINLRQWIEDNRGDWGRRRLIWQDSDFIAFVTRGPNRRKDFHVNPGDEILYQLEGELDLYYLKDNRRELAVLKPGEIFLMPGNVPHSPRRGHGSWTYVVERMRKADEMDRFIWLCESCDNCLHDFEVRFDEPDEALRRATASFLADPALAICNQCGHALEL